MVKIFHYQQAFAGLRTQIQGIIFDDRIVADVLHEAKTIFDVSKLLLFITELFHSKMDVFYFMKALVD